jgi:hypothetical protein
MSNDAHRKILNWFSGLREDDMRRIQKPLSTFLKGFVRTKAGDSPNVCRISPCAKHQYSRGVCASHYRQLAAMGRVVGWGQLAALGLCRTSGLRDLVVKRLPISGERSNGS